MPPSGVYRLRLHLGLGTEMPTLVAVVAVAVAVALRLLRLTPEHWVVPRRGMNRVNS